jgi:WD40 repeat protein
MIMTRTVSVFGITALLVATISTLNAQSPRDAATFPPIKFDRHGDALPLGAISRLGTVRLRHFEVGIAWFSSDGRSLVSIGNDGWLRYWEVPTGKELRAVKVPESVGIVDVTRDRTLIACWQEEYVFLDAATGKEVGRWKGRFNGFAPQDSLLPGGKLSVRDLDSPIKVDPNALVIESLPEWGVRSPDGNWLAEMRRGEIALWNIANKVVVPGDLKPADTEEAPQDCRFSRDSRTLITSWGSSIRVFDVATRRQKLLIPASTFPRIVLTPDDKYVAAKVADQFAGLFDLATGKEVRRWKVGDFSIAAFSADGNTMALTALHSIQLRNAKTGERLDAIRDNEECPSRLTFSPDGKSLLVNIEARELAVVDVASFRERTRLVTGSGDPPRFSVDGKSFLHAEGPGNPLDTTWQTFDLATGNVKRVDQAHADKLVGRAASVEDRRSVLAASPDQKWFFHDLITGEERHFLQDAEGKNRHVLRFVPPDLPFEKWPRVDLLTCAFSGDSKSFVVVTGDRRDFDNLREGLGGTQLIAWDTATGKERLRIRRNQPCFNLLSVSRDGRLIATTVGDTVNLFDATGWHVAELKGRGSVIRCVALSPDGTRLATGCLDTTVTLWDVSNVLKKTK